MVIWLVGQTIEWHPIEEGGTVWDFQGIFDSEEKAVKACKTKNYFVAPVLLNEEIPEESTEFPDSYYPLVEGK